MDSLRQILKVRMVALDELSRHHGILGHAREAEVCLIRRQELEECLKLADDLAYPPNPPPGETL